MAEQALLFTPFLLLDTSASFHSMQAARHAAAGGMFWGSMHFAHPLMHSVLPKGSVQACFQGSSPSGTVSPLLPLLIALPHNLGRIGK